MFSGKSWSNRWKQIVASSLIVLGSASVASAKDICITTGFSAIRFSKIKPLKPGRSVALNGVYIGLFGTALPVYGAAYMRMNGTVTLAVTISDLAGAGGVFHYAIEYADASLAGSGYYDSDGDGTSDGTFVWNADDCSTFSLP